MLSATSYPACITHHQKAFSPWELTPPTTTAPDRGGFDGTDNVARRWTNHAGGTRDDVRRSPAQGGRGGARSPGPDCGRARSGAAAAMDLRGILSGGAADRPRAAVPLQAGRAHRGLGAEYSGM